MPILKLIGSFLACITLGFVVGRVTASKPIEIITKTQTVDSKKQIAEVSTQADLQKDSTKDIVLINEHKTYSTKGKLESVDYQEKKYIDRTKNDFSKSRLAIQDVQDTKTIVSETKTLYQPNWLIGLSLPFASLRDYQHFDLIDVRALLAYRLIGNFYVTASTNYQLQYSQFGILYGF